jgi:peptidoglycan hydrolase CwlO-like protein
MASSLTAKQELTLSELEDRPANLRLKQRQIEREIMKMKIKIEEYQHSVDLLNHEIEKAEKDYTDYKSNL